MRRGVLVEGAHGAQLVRERRVLPVEKSRGMRGDGFVAVVGGFQPEGAVEPQIAVLGIEDRGEPRPAVAVLLVERDQGVEIRTEPQPHAAVARRGVGDQEIAAEQIVRPVQQGDLVEQPAMADEHGVGPPMVAADGLADALRDRSSLADAMPRSTFDSTSNGATRGFFRRRTSRDSAVRCWGELAPLSSAPLVETRDSWTSSSATSSA